MSEAAAWNGLEHACTDVFLRPPLFALPLGFPGSLRISLGVGPFLSPGGEAESARVNFNFQELP